MNVNTITMDQEAAREKAQQYREALARRSDAEWAQALTIFEALEQGLTLIDVGVAIREGGFDPDMRPRLALARADRRQVHFEWQAHNDRATFDTCGPQTTRREGLVETVNMNRRHGVRRNDYSITVQGWALVPMIPAGVRPRGQDRHWHILWEVEDWADRPIGAQPDPDPMLLRRLAGDLFIVLAEWDLTEVEMMVMRGRALVRP